MGLRFRRSVRLGPGVTTSGLDDLKGLIDEAALQRASLRSEIGREEQVLAAARRRLWLAQAFVLRIFFAAKPEHAEAVEASERRLADTHAQIEACFVEVDFALDKASVSTYAALTRSFTALSACQAIWHVTAAATADGAVERTTAATGVSRLPIRFSFGEPDLVRTHHPVMRLGPVDGGDLQLFPGFVMARNSPSGLGLIEFSALEVSFNRTPFIEDGAVPTDAQVVGETWRDADEDGSPEDRSGDDSALPIVIYGELRFSGPAGLLETYEFSQAPAAASFAEALAAHQNALADAGPGDLQGVEAAPEPVDHAARAPAAAAAEGDATPRSRPPQNLWLDWAAVVLIVFGLGSAAEWLSDQLPAPNQRPLWTASLARPVAPAATTASPASPPPSHPRHRRSAKAPNKNAAKETCIRVLTDPRQDNCQRVAQ